MNTPEAIASELSKPLDSRNVKPPKQYGPKGSYIEGWFAIQEANRIFGWDGWSYDVVDLRCVSERPRQIGREQKDGFGVSYLCTVKVTVGSVTRPDTGSGHGYDVDCGLAHESASKEAVTDALKRALRTFGNPFGLALYDKEKRGVEDGSAPKAPSNSTEHGKAAAWLEGARSYAELEHRWNKIAEDRPHIAGMQIVKDAFTEAAKRFAPDEGEAA